MKVRRSAVALLLVLAGAIPGERIAAQGPPAGVGQAGQAVELDGDLDVLYEDGPTNSRVVYFLRTARGRVPLRFSADGPDLPTGSRVRVRGNLADGGAVSNAVVSTMAASPSRTFGSQSALVILFNFSNNTVQPYTTAAVEAVNEQVRAFYLESSYNQTDMSFAVTGWYTIAATNATCDYSAWGTQADAAATAAGYDIASYDRILYAFPSTSACAWWGVGNVGGPRSWVNGTYATRVVSHEQGHNFGNRHSHALKCDSTGCISVDYGDDRDVLGAGGVVGHMNAFQKERLGWLNYGSSPAIQTVTTSGDYWVDNYVVAGNESKGLKIWNASAAKFYYVEARERVGFDTTVAPGVTLHTGIPGSSDSSYQLDLAPTSTTWDSTLDVGQTFVDSALGLSITALSSSLDGALVRVTFDVAPCSPVAPSVSMSPASQSGPAGTTFAYAVAVTNNNGAGCGPSPFTFSAAPPAGWTASFSAPSVAALAPGASASSTLSLASAGTASGSHAFTATAADGTSGLAMSASGSASITVPVSLSTTASATVSTGKTRAATVSVSVKNNGSIVSGAKVSITITKPTGVSTALSATTGSNGVATAKYSIGRRDPAGTYMVKVVATSGTATGTATTSFVVP